MRDWHRVGLFEIKNSIDFFKAWCVTGPNAGEGHEVPGIQFRTDDFWGWAYENPCKIPPKGEIYYSFAKTVYLEVFDFKRFKEITGATKIRNVSIHPSKKFSNTWCELNSCVRPLVCHRDSGPNGLPLENYAQAKGIIGLTGTAISDPIEGHPYYREEHIPVEDLDNFSKDRPYLIDDSTWKSNFRSKAAVLQIKIYPSASPGEKPTVSFMWSAEIFTTQKRLAKCLSGGI